MKPPPLHAFFGAAIANSIGTPPPSFTTVRDVALNHFSRLAVSMLYPLILAKTRVQLAKSSSSRKSRVTTRQVLYDEYRRKGGFPGGLYQGLEAQIAKGFLSQGITFMVKQR